MTDFARRTKRFGSRKNTPTATSNQDQPAPTQSKSMFDFMITCKHGFPDKPSAICFDEASGLMAIGTLNGELRIYGRPGLEFRAAYESKIPIKQIFPLGGNQFITVCADNTLFLWELGASEERLKFSKISLTMDDTEKDINVCCLSTASSLFYMGTENGNIYVLDLKTLQVLPDIIFWNNATAPIQSYARHHPGVVVAIEVNPQDATKVLIGFEKGVITLWSQMTNCPIKSFPASIDETKMLSSLSWHPDGYKFISGHRDGTYVVWSVSLNHHEEPPFKSYGEEECTLIEKILWLNPEAKHLLLFSGGLPISYSDKHTISVVRESTNICLEFPSKVIDYLVILDPSDGTGEILLVLCEEELLAFDLKSENLASISKPYLHSIHASHLMKICVYEGCTPQLLERLTTASKANTEQSEVSNLQWPVLGGCVRDEVPLDCTLLISGHEDGSVKFWDCTSQAMNILYTLETKKLFVTEEEATASENETFWPPFKRVGIFDPDSYDRRLRIHSLDFDPNSGMLVVGGEAGQVIVYELIDTSREYEIGTAECVVMSGHSYSGARSLPSEVGLEVQKNSVQFQPGFQPIMVLQCHPSKPVLNVTFNATWGIVAAGLLDAFVVANFLINGLVMTRSLNTNPEARQGKFQTMRRSMRKSWRQISHRQSMIAESSVNKDQRSTHATVNSLVLANIQTQSQRATPSLWVCTSSSMLLRYTIDLPEESQIYNLPTMMNPCTKNISLLHNAPIVGVILLDHNFVPLGKQHLIKNNFYPEPVLTNPTYALIISEEQLKIVYLPSLKARNKYKFTEGTAVLQRIAKYSFIRVKIRNKPTRQEDEKKPKGAQKFIRGDWIPGLLILTQKGNLYAFTLPELRVRRHATLLSAHDIRGIDSATFTQSGEIYHLASSSELQRCRTCFYNQQYYLQQDPSLNPYEGSTPLVYVDERLKRMSNEEFKDSNGASNIESNKSKQSAFKIVPTENCADDDDNPDDTYDVPRPVLSKVTNASHKMNQSSSESTDSDSNESDQGDSGEPLLIGNPLTEESNHMGEAEISEMMQETRRQMDQAKAYYDQLQMKASTSAH